MNSRRCLKIFSIISLPLIFIKILVVAYQLHVKFSKKLIPSLKIAINVCLRLWTMPKYQKSQEIPPFINHLINKQQRENSEEHGEVRIRKINYSPLTESSIDAMCEMIMRSARIWVCALSPSVVNWALCYNCAPACSQVLSKIIQPLKCLKIWNQMLEV